MDHNLVGAQFDEIYKLYDLTEPRGRSALAQGRGSALGRLEQGGRCLCIDD